MTGLSEPEAGGHEEGFARLEARVRGRVQGVGCRYFARHEALILEICGWVANREDGSVEAVAEGPRPVLEQFLARLRAGPPGAIVDDVAISWAPAAGGFEGFGIRSGPHTGD